MGRFYSKRGKLLSRWSLGGKPPSKETIKAIREKMKARFREIDGNGGKHFPIVQGGLSKGREAPWRMPLTLYFPTILQSLSKQRTANAALRSRARTRTLRAAYAVAPTAHILDCLSAAGLPLISRNGINAHFRPLTNEHLNP